MLFEIVDGTVAMFPGGVVLPRLVRQVLAGRIGTAASAFNGASRSFEAGTPKR
jgi:hypothetical protein